ncbi:MAG: LacI family DNA-binding transcriptional regulator [Deinococcus sp.]|nr:LacI family DNA-binding transcriptional regulator [Deinococcus sp.]
MAKRARVSPSTVSRALSHPEKVAETTRKRVLQVVAELG